MKLSKHLAIFLYSMIILSKVTVQASNIQINEIMASNATAYENPNSKFDDWIELKNNTATTINIGGYYLSDDKTQPLKWKIPANTLLYGYSYRIIYADGENSVMHTNFKLNEDGEFIGLYTPNGTVVDSFSFGKQRVDISFGRNQNTGSLVYFTKSTPGTSNVSSTITGICPSPIFSKSGGFYNTNQSIELSGQQGYDIYYSTDGTIPTFNSTKYSTPIPISTITCLRAICTKTNMLQSDVITHTYFINTQQNLPIISLTTNPNNFFSDDSGIYVIGTNGIAAGCSSTPMNLNQDWERPANIEYFDKNGIEQINQIAGVKIFGGCSRQRYPIKSLSLKASTYYGKNSFDYPFFKSRPMKSYEDILLRSASDDQTLTMMRDALSQTLCDDLEFETQAYQPVVLYINGEYWGIHNVREKYNEAYFEGNYGVNKSDVNIVDNNPQNSWNTKAGSADSYNNMIDYLNTHSLTNQANYEYIKTQIDEESFLDYMIALIYLGNNDWPGNNIRYWKSNTEPYNKWRWAAYDIDHTLKMVSQNWEGTNKSQNTLELATEENCNCNWPNPSWSTLLLRKLLENQTFRNLFIQGMYFQMNTRFTPSNIIHVVDSLSNNISAEIPNHVVRWGGQTVPNPESWIDPNFESENKWKENVEVMRYFAKVRPDTMYNIMLKFFKLSGRATINITNNIDNSGYFKIGYKLIRTKSHIANYFLNIPLTVTALPRTGYIFDHWEVTPSGESPQTFTTKTISYAPKKNTTIKAIYSEPDISDPIIVLNEINYHSSITANSGDWVELYNRSNSPIDLSGWKIMDGNHTHFFTLPQNSVIEANNYMVICQDTSLFSTIFSSPINKIGNFSFGLDNSGDIIRLFDAGNVLVDSVRYNDKSPWPITADGWGNTLELLSPTLDNGIAQNWTASLHKGTPGFLNQSDIDFVNINSDENLLLQNSPNPCKDYTNISFYLDNYNNNVKLEIYNFIGIFVSEYDIKQLTEGQTTIKLDVSKFPSGIYFYCLEINNRKTLAKKMIINQ